MDQDALSTSQREALNQLQALTNGGDPDVAMGVLESVDWDVQRAADVIFGSHPSAPLNISSPSQPEPTSPPSSNNIMDNYDESEQGLLSGQPSNRGYRRQSQSGSSLSLIVRPLRLILSILAFPFHILRAIFRILHIPLPQLPITLSSLTVYYRSSGAGRTNDFRMDPRSVAERWVHALEEETGVLCASRARIHAGEGSASGVGPSNSNLTARKQDGSSVDVGERVLPDFFLGSYEEFAKACANELDAKIGCVILVSDEHDDDAEFKRSTLTDPKFVGLMQSNNFLVWGGDVRDRDAWSAAQKLEATTYPFVAFIALQPRRGPSSRAGVSSPPSLTILSRHQGPSIPPSSAPTSSTTLIKHLTDNLLPRVTPFLIRTRNQAAERETLKALETASRQRDRQIRAEQDRVYEETWRKDKERIEARLAEERRSKEEARVKEEALKREEEQKNKAMLDLAKWESKKMAWRRWGRRGLVPREPRPGNGDSGRGKTIRISVRMPDGKRGVRFFGENDSVTAVFAFVDTLFIPTTTSTPQNQEFSSDLDPATPPDGYEIGEEGLIKAMTFEEKNGEDWWGFKLATTYPRREISWEGQKKIGEVDGLRGGGQLIVEIVDNRETKSLKSVKSSSSSVGNGKGKEKATAVLSEKGSDDEYETESD
ncbi:UBX domain-containing protein [Abortiporus biennis]